MAHLDGPFRLAILTTGGTIEKTYDETDGSLRNVRSVLQEILRELRLPGLEVTLVPVMAKDSLDMTEADRDAILAAVREALGPPGPPAGATDPATPPASPRNDAVLVIHGTDTLAETGERLHARLSGLDRPVVLTGAFRPWEFRDTDAVQNVTESILATRLLGSGVFAAFHGRVHPFPGVEKDRERRTFRRRA